LILSGIEQANKVGWKLVPALSARARTMLPLFFSNLFIKKEEKKRNPHKKKHLPRYKKLLS